MVRRHRHREHFAYTGHAAPGPRRVRNGRVLHTVVLRATRRGHGGSETSGYLEPRSEPALGNRVELSRQLAGRNRRMGQHAILWLFLLAPLPFVLLAAFLQD